jgi:hypothetical protein
MATLNDAIEKVKKLDLSTSSGRQKAAALLKDFKTEIGSRGGPLGHVSIIVGGPPAIEAAGGIRVGFEGKDIFIRTEADAKKHEKFIGKYANSLRPMLKL